MVQFTVLSTGVKKMQQTHTETVQHTHTHNAYRKFTRVSTAKHRH